MSTATTPVNVCPARRLQVHRLDLLGLGAFTLLAITFYMAFFYAPTELIQGEPQRIFYVHLPMALTSYIAFAVVFVCSILYLSTRKPIFDMYANSAAELGVLFTTLVIVSGGLWGQATWGTFWQWEPRLTFTFVLWLMYVAYLMLRQAASDKEAVARYSAVLGILGFCDVPLVFLSVYLWRGLHPEPTNPPAQIGYTVLVGMAAFFILFAYMLIQRVRLERTRHRIEDLRATLEG